MHRPRCEARVTALVEDLVNLGCRPVLVSGLAYGIDASAHRASLKFGLTTLAVLGHGLHMIYPATHKSMARQILETGGAWISEFPCIGEYTTEQFLTPQPDYCGSLSCNPGSRNRP